MSVFTKIVSFIEQSLIKVRYFFENTADEMKKSSWPSWDQLLESTLLVVVTLIIATIFVAGADQIISKTVNYLISF